MSLPDPVPAPGSPTGADTMSPAMREMRAYPRYLFDQVFPSLGNRVWEVGVGHGTYTTWLREAGKTVLATDIDAGCLERAAARFGNDPAVSLARVDLMDAASVHAHSDFGADSILCFNVLEHIAEDESALVSLRTAVRPDAVLGLIVPAHPSLMGRMDREAGHVRRYTRHTLRQVLASSGWSVDRLRYLNALGAAGWWFHNRWRTSAGLADATVNRQMRAADRWLPRVARWTDPWLQRLMGLSVLAIARAGPTQPGE